MKKTAFAAALILLLSFAGIHAMNRRNTDARPDGRKDIAGLWKEYESARDADRPQRQLEILEDIKSAAREQRSAWDFYTAGQNFVDISIRRNWKLRDSLNRQLRKDIEEFDEPVMTFCYDRMYVKADPEFITKNKAVLESARNEGFYSTGGLDGRSGYVPVSLSEYIENDYQFTLWATAVNNRPAEDGAAECLEMLQSSVNGRYPAEQLLDLYRILSSDDSFRRKEWLETFADRNKGKAVSLAARQELLQIAFDELRKDSGSTSEQYRQLRKDCGDFEKERSSYSGKEKVIAAQCNRVESLIRTLDYKSIDTDYQKGVLTVGMQNVDKVDVIIKDKDRTILSTTLTNPVGSYYVQDTVSCTLPPFDDGEYTAEFSYGKAKEEIQIRKYSVAISQRYDAAGYAIFLADALTGEPVRSADLELIDEDGKTEAEYKGMVLDGFTYLPEQITKHFSKDSWKNNLRCTYKGKDGLLHKTDVLHIYSDTYSARKETSDNLFADIFTDRTSFNPDETVHFKVVAYHGDRSRELSAVGKGKPLTAKLLDTEGNVISSMKLTTDEFGSAAGDFILERRSRNGYYRLNIYDGSRELNGVALRVDDFVLPTFELNFDRSDRLYFPGDEVLVNGTLKSYSGHSLSAADIRYTVLGNGKLLKGGSLKLDGDGRFSIPFTAEGNGDYLYFAINVTVTDATGETLSWNTVRNVYRHIPFSGQLLNRSDAALSVPGHHEYRQNEFYSSEVVSDDIFRIKLHTGNEVLESSRPGLSITYTLSSEGKIVGEGKAAPGETLELDTTGMPSGKYTFTARAEDRDAFDNKIEAYVCFDIHKVKEDDDSLPFEATNMFRVIEGDGISVQIGTTSGPTWACVEIFGEGNRLLGSRIVKLDGIKGKAGSLTTVSFAWPQGQTSVFLHVIYFKNYSEYSYSHTFDRSAAKLELPLDFTRFEDRTAPGTKYSFEISTRPDVECAATIFDKSTESIMTNRWNRIYIYSSHGPYVSYNTDSGSDSSNGFMLYENGLGVKRMVLAKAAAPMMADADMEFEDSEAMVMEEAMAEESSAVQMDGGEVSVRENFANTIAFEPFLKSDASGKIILDFTTSDKLSTYYVQLFAHDRNMNNNVLRREMMVTIPVKVSVVEPQFLYAGDRYVIKASLSSNMAEPVKGWLKADLYNGKDYKNSEPFKSIVKQVELGAVESLSQDFEVTVPEIKELGIKLSFIADGISGSDAVFVSVPVYPAVQTLTEAHSAVLHNGESLESLLETLKSQFANTDASDAEMKTISVIDMVREAVPSKVETSSDDVISLSEALYVRILARKLGSDADVTASDQELLDKILVCRRSDGGFSWFESMDSSPVVTATLLQRYAGLRRRGLIDPQSCGISIQTVKEAVSYLDRAYFGGNGRPLWCGGISYEQYVSTRAMFPEVPFSGSDIDSKQLKEFKKETKEYLTPKNERGLEGYILGKARRMRILLELSGSEDGRKLANSWGVTLGTVSKLRNSLYKDLQSILEYAVEHRSGGCYYPNAVMPFRGLLESEAYAHAYIADMLSECAGAMRGKADDTSLDKAMNIADGIRLWLMIQKETQKWDEDAAFVDALSSIMDASEDVLNLKVVSLSETFTKPLDEIKASGNGFTISRLFYVSKADDAKVIPLEEGDPLCLGDKVIAEYHIWNEENRSFIKVTAPRMASLRPVNQLSGNYGWWLRPLHVAGWMSFAPQGYRSVLKDRTEYWFDSYPEENTVITEEFFVTQTGTFQTAAIEIESIYAPHYRANGEAHAPIASE